jgi:sugar phosphate isomerase/epimerase
MKEQGNSNSDSSMTRREWLGAGVTAGLGSLLALPRAAAGAEASAAARSESSPYPAAASKGFRFCLNTGTIRGQNLSFDQEIEVAAKAGFDGIEPWLEKIDQYVKKGGSLKDLRQKLTDLNVTLEDAIGFPSWAVEDEAQRAKGFEQVKVAMDTLAQLGGKRVAAPPAGVPQGQRVEPERVAERYRQLLELGDRMGVRPVLEFWGRNPTIGKLSTAVFIAVESGHPQACVLADVFHMYRGDRSFEGLRLLSGHALPILHLNDYPANPPREQANDSQRVMPGDGVGPLAEILRMVRGSGAFPVLSLELFNREHWKQDALETARLGLRKMKAVAAASAG